MHTLLSVHWDKEFDDLEHQIGFDMEASKFIEAGEMEEDKEYYGINFFPLDSCTEYLKEQAGNDCFIEYPDIVKKEIIRQSSGLRPYKDWLKFDLSSPDFIEKNFGQFIMVLDYKSWKDEWAGDYDESIYAIGILGVDCEIKLINTK